MVSYDPAVIRTFAQALYGRAATIILVYTAIGVIVGGAVGKFAFGNTGMFILAALAGGIGYFVGSQRAFMLKLQAQTALCQVQIEQNTQSQGQHTTPNSSPAPQRSHTSAATVAAAAAEPTGPMGTCPNCSSVIPLDAQDCPNCKASFGIGSSWTIVPR